MSARTRPKPHTVRDAYDAMSGWYDLVAGPGGEAVARQALTMLSAREGEDILELGPGTGRALLALAEAVGASGRVCGVDVSLSMLRRAQQRLVRAGRARRLALLCGDATHLPLRSSSADAALAILTLEVLDRDGIAQALAECRRVLRPGGRLVVAAMTEGRRRHVMSRLYRWARRRYPLWVNCRPIRPRDLLVGAGFGIVDVSRASAWGLPVEIVLARSPVPR